MPTTFDVIYLGNLAEIHVNENSAVLDTSAVNSWLGTYGSSGSPLYGDVQSWAPGAVGFSGGDADAYDLRQTSSADTVSIDGGADQVVDALMLYNATITYDDGTTATITATLVQLDNGDVFWVPEYSDNADQAAMEAKPIVSLTLDSPIYASGGAGYNTVADRQTWDFVCFAERTRILTDRGEKPIEELNIGDRVQTLDNGFQEIRWIGSRKTSARGRMAPVRISKGLLNANRDLLLSPQHRIFVNSSHSDILLGEPEMLATAKHLRTHEGIFTHPMPTITYFHLLFDSHEVIWANGVLAESLHLGEEGIGSLGIDARAEIETLFPELTLRIDCAPLTARPVMRGFEATLLEQLSI